MCKKRHRRISSPKSPTVWFLSQPPRLRPEAWGTNSNASAACFRAPTSWLGERESVFECSELANRTPHNVPLHQARLVTTMWDGSYNRRHKLEGREKELVSKFWRSLIEEGARDRRFENTGSSAFLNIDEFLSMESAKDDLLLQEELVKQQERLNEAEAGKVLYSRLQKHLVEQMNTLMALADDARLHNDPALAKSLEEEYNQINAR